MTCFYPKQALRTNALTSNGKRAIRFIDSKTAEKLVGNPDLLSGLPCGQCTGCRLERSRQWAVRMLNEADLHSANSFITLTFDDDNLKKRDNPMSLDKRDFQLFMKDLRYELYKQNLKIRYYMCGEYGELFKRPHYHAVIFGYDFPDKQLYKVNRGLPYYTSDFLKSVWPYGFNVVTDVTFDTCAYVARYIMKKHFGKDAWKRYIDYINEETGEIIGHRIPEYTTMSRADGIGKAWLDKYLQDVYPRDKIFMRHKKVFCKPPKYYDSQYEIINPSDYLRIKKDRIEQAILCAPDDVQRHLHAKKTIKDQQIKILKRNLE